MLLVDLSLCDLLAGVGDATGLLTGYIEVPSRAVITY